jgi:colicin import membrane protein
VATLRLFILTACGLAAGCASEAVKVQPTAPRPESIHIEPASDDGSARVEARDAVARARADEEDAKAQLEVSRTEREIADAELRRVTEERDLLRRQAGPQAQLAQAERDVRVAQTKSQAGELERVYLERVVQAAEEERKLAEAEAADAEDQAVQLRREAAQLRSRAAEAYHKWQASLLAGAGPLPGPAE